MLMHNNAMLPHEAVIVKKRQEAENIFILYLRLTDEKHHEKYTVQPGQFNMLYAPGLGEIPISVVYYDEKLDAFAHIIHIVGDVTEEISFFEEGDFMGLRGSYGNGWPIQCEKKNIISISGGTGIAPLSLAIDVVIADGKKNIAVLHGVRSKDLLVLQHRFEKWKEADNTQVLIANACHEESSYCLGDVTDLIEKIEYDILDSTFLICGPQSMMDAVIEKLLAHGVNELDIFLSLERNMQCGIGICGHCQCHDKFVCIDGPVFCWAEFKDKL